MVLLILTIAAPLEVFAQTEITTQEKPVTAKADTDTAKTDRPFADEIDDDEWAITAAFDSLENAFSSENDQFFDIPDSSKRRNPSNVLTYKDKAALEAAKRNIFVPDPQRALWLSFVLPGGGQIYNRKYWKLPLFYGGFLGCMYAFTWNQQMYMDYSQAYLDIMDDNPNTNSYITMFPPSYDIENNISRFQTVFKNRKDRYRRWRDLSTFCFIGVYALSIIDAYVDAHLSVFDISPDLSLQWGPTSIEGPHHNVGLGATLNF